MDQTDIKILALLQKDATCSVAEIAEQVNLSVTPCWRRIQKLRTTASSRATRSCWTRRRWA